ncbi:MAG: type II toxin-antitoxin system Phd/YefM family antitoxin [Polyangiaceae bacterium]
MNAIAAARFKATCLAILDEVEQTGAPVVITKRGRPVAKIIRYVPHGDGIAQDSLRGSVTFVGDIVSPAVAPAEWEAEQCDSGRGKDEPAGPAW